MSNGGDKSRGRPRLDPMRKRHRVNLYVSGETIVEFERRFGRRWRVAMAEFLEAAVKGWRNSDLDGF